MPDNAERIRRLYEAAGRGNFESWGEVLHEGVEWRAAGQASYFGAEAVLTGLRDRVDDFDGFAIDVHRIISAGDTVVVQARYRAIGKATGKVLDAQVAHVWDLRDGKIVRIQQYTDTWQFTDVTGVRNGSAYARPCSAPVPHSE